MLRMNHPAVLVAAVAAFILSSFYYRLFAQQIVDLHPTNPEVAAAMMKPAPWKVLAEVGRTVVVPVKLAAIHSGDWLFKTVLITVILGVWRR